MRQSAAVVEQPS